MHDGGCHNADRIQNAEFKEPLHLTSPQPSVSQQGNACLATAPLASASAATVIQSYRNGGGEETSWRQSIQYRYITDRALAPIAGLPGAAVALYATISDGERGA